MRRLLIRPGGIGDCITCLPVMEWLHVDWTEVWVPSPVIPLIQFANRVRPISGTGIELVGLHREFPRNLSESLCAFDEIWSWYGSNRPEFRDEVQALNPNWRFLPALPPNGYPQQVSDFHAIECGAPLGQRPSIRIEATEDRATTVIHPFSGGWAKNWPLERFRELAGKLELPVEWTAGPEEELPKARRFENLLDLAQWIRGAALYIGNDSGITHLAAATGVATLGLYNELNAKTWGARGDRVQLVVKPSVNDIEVDEVLDEAMRLIRRGQSRL